ncbi:unnamed protein product, partial [Mesorhabditis belari]|uniref:glutathione transferase n=1 Tax=Mesorhabditis belari TaxID=2138241 RepID=A0AAF3EPW1_9BILA
MGYTFHYFPLRAVGEPVRQLFKIAGKDFEDKRITFEEWMADVKPTMPFNQLPVLELEDGTMIAQSAAIARYLGKEFGILWGKNNLEAAKVDGFIDLYKDYYNEIRQFYYTALGVLQGNLDELYESVLVPAADKFFALVEGRIEKEGHGYLVGSEISYADLVVCDHMVTLNNLRPEYLKKHPKLAGYQEKVYSHPALKKWLDERPEDKM